MVLHIRKTVMDGHRPLCLCKPTQPKPFPDSDGDSPAVC